MTPIEVNNNQQSIDLDLLARTIYGEGRSEDDNGLAAIAHVIMNRSKKWGKSIKDIVLAPKQFSSWNQTDPNMNKMLTLSETDPDYIRSLNIAKAVLAGEMVDPTDGATDYHTITPPPGKTSWPPYWAPSYEATKPIGGHMFYRRPAKKK